MAGNANSRFHKFQPKKPDSLSRVSHDDDKHPDGVMLLQTLMWNVTVPDTYADFRLTDTATTAGAAANKVASNKKAKYVQLPNSHIFVPVAQSQL